MWQIVKGFIQLECKKKASDLRKAKFGKIQELERELDQIERNLCKTKTSALIIRRRVLRSEIFALYVTCSNKMSHIVPETYFEVGTPLQRGDY